MTVTSVRQAAAGVCNVSPPVVRRWVSIGLIPGRLGRERNYWRFATSQIPKDDDAAIVGPTGPLRDGMRDAVAPDAVNSRAKRRGPVGEPGRNSG
jgi:hypothetical protein